MDKDNGMLLSGYHVDTPITIKAEPSIWPTAAFINVSGYHADTPITIKAEPSIWPTAAFINIHEHPI